MPSGDMIAQSDAPNLQRIQAQAGVEVERYFGCWLDINNPNDGRFPQNPGMATSFAGTPANQLKSLFDLIGDFHQCLVAEVYYKRDTSAPDLVVPGATPSSSDKLAQRNLAFGTSGNPGAAATRTVQHTFELKPSRGGRLQKDDRMPHDELVLWWPGVPRDSVATIYLPEIAASELVALISPAHGRTLSIVGKHTVRCTIGGHTVIPIPVRDRRITGLLTLELPAGVRKGETYRVIAQQISGLTRHIIGAFEMRIAVKKDPELHADDLARYAILLAKLERMATGDRFRPVLLEYARQLAARITALGVDPKTVKPSPYGHPSHGKHGGRPELELDLSIDAKIKLVIRRRDDD